MLWHHDLLGANNACGYRICIARIESHRAIRRGLDNIDVAYATEQGIPVANVPDYCFIDVAEQTMALLLGLSHKVAQFDRLIRSGTWDIQAGLPLRRLTGQVLGLIGFGQIAREVVPRARAFGLHVLAYSRSLTPEQAHACGVEFADLDTLLRTSDFVSLHCPSTDETARPDQYR